MFYCCALFSRHRLYQNGIHCFAYMHFCMGFEESYTIRLILQYDSHWHKLLNVRCLFICFILSPSLSYISEFCQLTKYWFCSIWTRYFQNILFGLHNVQARGILQLFDARFYLAVSIISGNTIRKEPKPVKEKESTVYIKLNNKIES